MSENQQTPIETTIADFLGTHDITIIPETRGNYKVLGYVRHTGGDLQEIGETVFDNAGNVQPASTDEIRKRLELPGFVNNVTRPIAMLLRQTQGRFFEDPRWDVIHDACDSVEARHP